MSAVLYSSMLIAAAVGTCVGTKRYCVYHKVQVYDQCYYCHGHCVDLSLVVYTIVVHHLTFCSPNQFFNSLIILQCYFKTKFCILYPNSMIIAPALLSLSMPMSLKQANSTSPAACTVNFEIILYIYRQRLYYTSYTYL